MNYIGNSRNLSPKLRNSNTEHIVKQKIMYYVYVCHIVAYRGIIRLLSRKKQDNSRFWAVASAPMGRLESGVLNAVRAFSCPISQVLGRKQRS